jgi:hypothetical protein
MSLSKLSRAVTLSLVLASMGGCSRCSAPPEPLKMWAIEFGTEVDAANRVTSPTRTFTPQSTVYASIETKGTGKGTLIVEWTVGTPATIVSTEKRDVNPSEPAHFAFHFTPSEGWPKGTNRVRFGLEGGQHIEGEEAEKHIAEFQVE